MSLATKTLEGWDDFEHCCVYVLTGVAYRLDSFHDVLQQADLQKILGSHFVLVMQILDLYHYNCGSSTKVM